MDAIRSAKYERVAENEELDVLLNDSRIRGDTPQTATKVCIDQSRRGFKINLFGLVHKHSSYELTQKLDQTRIVNVTSDFTY